LSVRLAQNISRKRAYGCTRENLDGYYDLLEQKMIELGIMDKPGSIFNADEIGWFGSFDRKKLFARRGERNPHILTSDNEKIMYTTMVTPIFKIYELETRKKNGNGNFLVSS
jgi:hypothetical protein